MLKMTDKQSLKDRPISFMFGCFMGLFYVFTVINAFYLAKAH